jgi:hypothetical protein
MMPERTRDGEVIPILIREKECPNISYSMANSQASGLIASSARSERIARAKPAIRNHFQASRRIQP